MLIVFDVTAFCPTRKRPGLGLWFKANEGAEVSAKVLSDLRNRGVQDLLIAVVDSLKGFPQDIEAAVFQTCIVHLVRPFMNFARFKGHAIDSVDHRRRR